MEHIYLNRPQNYRITNLQIELDETKKELNDSKIHIVKLQEELAIANYNIEQFKEAINNIGKMVETNKERITEEITKQVANSENRVTECIRDLFKSLRVS